MKKHGNVDVANIIAEGERKREKPKRMGMKGGHYARADGSVRPSDSERYDHKHDPAENPAVEQSGEGFWEEMLHPDSSSAENHGEFFLNLAQNIDDHLQGKQTNWSDLMPTKDSGVGAAVDVALTALMPGFGEAEAAGEMGSVLAAGESAAAKQAAAAESGAIRTSEGLVDAEGNVAGDPYAAMKTQAKANIKKGLMVPATAVGGEEGVKMAVGEPDSPGPDPFPAGAAQAQSNYAESARAFAMANTQPFATSGINPWG